MGKMSRILLLAVLTATLVTNSEAQDVGVKDFTITAPPDITDKCEAATTYTFTIVACEIDGSNAEVTAVNVYYTDSADFNAETTQKSNAVEATDSSGDAITISVTADSEATSSGAEADFAAESTPCPYSHICVVTTTTGDTNTKNDFMCIKFSDSTKSSAHCPPANCLDPGDIENGQKSGDTLTHKSTITYTCSEGYHLVGEATLTCYDGDWDNTKPTCSEDTPVTTVEATTDSGTKSATTESGVAGLIKGMYSILVAFALWSALVNS